MYQLYEEPFVRQINGGIAQVFPCRKCMQHVLRYQDTLDRNSTKGLHAHSRLCRGVEEHESLIYSDLAVQYSREPLSNRQMRSVLMI